MKTFLFYDIETSGLSPYFDQILTFASIRTDLYLNEIERSQIIVNLRKDIVPSPGAFLTHGLTHEFLKAGICEYEAAQKIHKIVNHPGTISLGYNSLGFDDEFLRFSFYRNLLDAYTHQYNNGCSRMDILPIATLYRVFNPDIIKWPQIDGKPSLKLDLISEINDFKTSGRAHEAMNDVEAVLALSKRFSTAKKMWDYALGFFSKTKEEIRIHQINTEFELAKKGFKLCIMVSASFGAKANYIAPVLHLGDSLAYKNQSLWVRLDTKDVTWLDSDQELTDTFVIRKRSVDSLIVLPLLKRFKEKLTDESQKQLSENLEKFRNNPEQFLKFINYHITYKYPIIPDLDADASLYQSGFFTGLEKKEIALFHRARDAQKYLVCQNFKCQRIKLLANRILLRNYIEKIPESSMAEFSEVIENHKQETSKGCIKGFKNDTKFSVEKGINEMLEFKKQSSNLNQQQKEMLDWLGEYLDSL